MSVFYAAKFQYRYPISMLAFERLTQLSELSAEEAVPKVLAECCHISNPSKEDLIYFLERLQAEHVDSPSETKVTKASKSLGTAYQAFLGKLDSARLLLWACGFDFAKADYLYSQVDQSITTQIIEDFITLQNEQNTYLFEAVMYGFGGKYNEDGADANLVDATEMSANELKKLLMRH